MEFQQPQNRYMRPPQPPPPADPNHHQPSVVPPPPAPTWFSGQFQFHGHSPSPPPPNHNQQHWPPPPPPPPHDPYHAPPSYPAHHQYPLPPPPPRPTPNQSYTPMPQAYPPQHSQEWHNSGWNQNQHLQHPALNNGEDWAAKAKAWAAAQTSVDNQYPQSQYAPVGRIEENQYSMNPHYSDGQHYTVAASNYQQHQPPIAPSYQSSETSFNSGYVPEGHLPFNGRNGSLVGDSNAALPHQESFPPSLSVHRQEVPSSYSSVAGKEDNQNEQFYNQPWTFTSTSQQQAQPNATGGTVSVEQPHYAFSHQSAEPPRDLSDQPLDFAAGFTRDHDQHVQSNHSHNSGIPARGIDSPSAMASIHAWSSPVAPGVVYPPVHPPGPQVDTSLAIPSPVPGHFGQLFGRISGQNFQSMGPSVSVPFGGAGTYPGDGFGASTVSDRPKKAVPNWLREEIIKKKAVIATAAPEYSEDTKSMEEEAVDRSSVKGDPDSKSVDSPVSTEEEDDEEHDVEIARTAAINQEIKRVLTEVLLKVTDELFNEIATKVLSEEVDHDIASPNHEVSPSAPAVPTPKASAKVLITGKSSEDDSVNSRKLATSAPGDLLGLASYASDDDEDDDVQNIGVPNSKRNMIHQPSTPNVLPDDLSDSCRIYPNGSTGNDNGEEGTNKADISMSKDNIEKFVMRNDCSVDSIAAKKVISDDTGVGEARKQPDKNDKYDKRRSSSGKDIVKDVGGDEIYRRQEERKVKKVKTDELDRSKEKLKEQVLKTADKSMDLDYKKRSSHHDDKVMKETEIEGRTRGKESNERKKDRTREDKRERSREKITSDSGRHKRHRSSSVESRGRDSKNHVVASHANNSSNDESSEDSRRKSRSRKRKSSPSPVRSRRRHVSRSPHSKHSQRRHSPYSSLETTRRKKSRSKSPVRRKR